MASLFLVFDIVLDLYMWVLIIAAIMSWLIAFNVVNPYNQFVHTVVDLTTRLTEPALRVIRRYLPRLSGLDLSPVVLILIIIFVRSLLREYGPL